MRRVVGWLKTEGPPLVGLVGLAMFLAWRLGQEVGWDLRNYHFYNAYLLLDYRFARDIEPAGVQTYFNPLFDIPFYVGVKVWNLSPIVVGLAHAAFHGLNLWLVYRLVKLLLSADHPLLASVAAPVAAVTGALGAAFSMEVGSTSDDNTMSVFVLAALVVLIAGIGPVGSPPRRSVRWSGLLIGLATGAKPVAAMYAVGLLGALLVTGAGVRERAVRALNFAVSAAVGVVATYGYWMWLMFRHFGTPLFPFLDASMRSIYAPVTDYLATRFMPRTLTQAVFYPFFFVTEQTLVGELPFRDGRFAIGFVSVVVFAAVAIVRRWRNGTASRSVGDTRIVAFVVFAAASYIAWERLSSIYRYAVSLELTAAVLLIACLAYWLRSTARSLAVALPACLLLVAFTKPAAMVHVPWAPTYFGVDENALSSYRDATILMWDFPNAYVVPFFPSSTTFIRIFSNWSYASEPAVRSRVFQRIRSADPSRVYLLDLPQSEPQAKQRALASFGLTLDPLRCQPFSTLLESGRLCGVVDARAGASLTLVATAPAAPPTYEGYYDVTNCSGIMGWAWDQSRPDVPLEIDLYDGTHLFTRVTANQFRQDLLQAQKGNGRHGFMMPTPSELQDGKAHDIYMKFAGTLAELNNGPKQITCAPR